MAKEILDLLPGECRYIIQDKPTHYCADPTLLGHSWCSHHYSMVFMKDSRGRPRSPIMLPVDKLEPHKSEPEPDAPAPTPDVFEVMEEQK